jgi:hypothetical protein
VDVPLELDGGVGVVRWLVEHGGRWVVGEGC